MDRRVPWLVRTLSWCLKPLSTDELALPKACCAVPTAVKGPRGRSAATLYGFGLRPPSQTAIELAE